MNGCVVLVFRTHIANMTTIADNGSCAQTHTMDYSVHHKAITDKISSSVCGKRDESVRRDKTTMIIWNRNCASIEKRCTLVLQTQHPAGVDLCHRLACRSISTYYRTSQQNIGQQRPPAMFICLNLCLYRTSFRKCPRVQIHWTASSLPRSNNPE